MRIFKTYTESFRYNLENRMEADEYEACKKAEGYIVEWLSDADDEIELLKKEIKRLKTSRG